MRVPVKAHALADPEKGSGIAMICTFGDITDVTWWRELSLPVRAVIQPNGALRADRRGARRMGIDGRRRARSRPTTSSPNLSAAKARAKIVEQLRESGDLIGEPRPITHPVKFYEKGDRPLEIITSRQWFIKTMEFRDALLARGRELQWHPEYMRHRLRELGQRADRRLVRQPPAVLRRAVSGLVSGRERRQPRLRPPDRARRIAPADRSVDRRAGRATRPSSATSRTDSPAIPDVMDTWATSSLTPQIAGGWLDDPDLFARVFPMDLRPQAHDIIRTWLFTTVLRSHLEHDSLPWAHAALSGFVLDPDRKKMSKSKGNVVTPMGAARGTRLRWRAVLGGERATRHRHRRSIRRR